MTHQGSKISSSEDDKVPPTPSTLESVTEMTEAKPAEDRTSDKLSDEGLGTSEVDKTEEEKLNEVSDASNEDLMPGRTEPSKDLISQDATEPKPEEGEPVVSQPEEPEDTADTQELVADGQETEEQEKMLEEKTEDETAKVITEETEPEEVKKEEENEAGTEESRETEEQPNDASEELESKPGDTAQAGEESKEPDEEMPQLKASEDRIEDIANGMDIHTENIEY